MKLYVCYDFLKNVRTTGRPGGHPCGNALHALREAGHEPEVDAVGGLGLPGLNKTKGRAKVEELTGQRVVPVLVHGRRRGDPRVQGHRRVGQAHPASAA